MGGEARVAGGRIQAVVQAISNLGPLLKARPDTFEIVNQTIGPKTYYAWAVRNEPDTASLREFLNQGLLFLLGGPLEGLEVEVRGSAVLQPLNRLRLGGLRGGVILLLGIAQALEADVDVGLQQGMGRVVLALLEVKQAEDAGPFGGAEL